MTTYTVTLQITPSAATLASLSEYVASRYPPDTDLQAIHDHFMLLSLLDETQKKLMVLAEDHGISMAPTGEPATIPDPKTPITLTYSKEQR